MIGKISVIVLLVIALWSVAFACSDETYPCWIMGEGFYCWDFKDIDEAKKTYKELKEMVKVLEKLNTDTSRRWAYHFNNWATHTYKCCIEPGVMWETREFYEKNWDKKGYDMNNHPYWEAVRKLKLAEDEDE